jgi:hypothetical protein
MTNTTTLSRHFVPGDDPGDQQPPRRVQPDAPNTSAPPARPLRISVGRSLANHPDNPGVR